ncbi:MAG TPA: alpha-amylase family glycosyl hydrolase [Herpetosiphonaceae bacterium]|nr:alpha-amylase family glycosyl hydrolase [Herpetosiphonaceae bacterium]
MRKIVQCIVLLALVAGCSGQDATPSPTPAEQAAAPTTAPTVAPTVAPTLAPTAAPTTAPTRPPRPTATPQPAPAWTAEDERWAGRSIYFLLTDRFANGDPSNDGADGFGPDLADPRGWHGGDFQGVIDQLDYIKGMGFDAIWITPVTRQKSANAFHGYWQYDPYQIDPHLGSMDKLKELVAAAHERDMLVMIDVVPNHMGDFQPGSTAAPPFDDPSWYHNKGNIANYGNQQEVEQGDLLGLDDLNQENPATRAELLKWITWLRDETGLDGLRVDTAKHMPGDFLTEFNAAADTYSMGEVFNSFTGYVAPYSRQLDSVADYPFYEAAKESLGGSKPLQILQRVFADDGLYRNIHTVGTFLDNHDNERFLCLATGGPDDDKQAQLHQALAVMFTVRGIPIVYYGTEQGFAGCADPANREDMFAAFDPASETYAWLAKLNALRKAHPSLIRGSTADRYLDSDGWAFQRTSGDDTAVVCVNNVWRPYQFSAGELAGLPDGTVLTDALGGGSVTVEGGAIPCDLADKQVAVYVK